MHACGEMLPPFKFFWNTEPIQIFAIELVPRRCTTPL